MKAFEKFWLVVFFSVLMILPALVLHEGWHIMTCILSGSPFKTDFLSITTCTLKEIYYNITFFAGFFSCLVLIGINFLLVKIFKHKKETQLIFMPAILLQFLNGLTESIMPMLGSYDVYFQFAHNQLVVSTIFVLLFLFVYWPIITKLMSLRKNRNKKEFIEQSNIFLEEYFKAKN